VSNNLTLTFIILHLTFARPLWPLSQGSVIPNWPTVQLETQHVTWPCASYIIFNQKKIIELKLASRYTDHAIRPRMFCDLCKLA